MSNPKPCRTCKAPILLVRRAEKTALWTVVDAEPVHPSAVLDASKIRILRGAAHAYKLDHLREVLSFNMAFDHDGPQRPEHFPWHHIHQCKEG